MVKKIEYVNKEAIQNDTTIADKNKVTDKDMNEIKEVVNNNADELTTVEKEISEIDEEQSSQNIFIATLQQRLDEKDNQIADLKAENEDLKADLSNSQIHGQVSGEYVHLVDSAKMNCDIAVLGNSKQETREGYNLFNKDEVTRIATYYGSISYVDSILTTPAFKPYNWIKFFTSITLSPGTYYFSFKVKLKSGTCEKFNKISFNNDVSDVTETVLKFVSNAVSSTYQNIKAKIDVTDTLDIQNIFINVPTGTSDAVLEITDVMLSNKDAEYEPYGAMPSLDYPSEIESVSSANVKVWNKNFADNNFEQGSLSAVDSRYGGDYPSNRRIRTKYILVNPSTSYTIKVHDVNKKIIYLCEYDKNKKANKDLAPIYTFDANEVKITTKETTKYIRVAIHNGDDSDLTPSNVEKLQVEQGTTATDYIPHEEQNYPVDMQEQFRAIGDIRDCFVLKEDGKWYERHKVGEYIFTGNEDISNQVYSDVNVYSIHKSNIANINAEWKSTELKSNLFKAVTEISKKGELAVGANYINFYYDDNVDVNGFKTWLSEQYSKGIPLKIQYLLLTPIDIECTEQQTQQLQALQKAKTYKNITNITTDTIAVLDVDYKRDLETIVNNINTAIVSLGGV